MLGRVASLASNSERYDVVIIGAGLAGLTLARHLLLASDRRVLLIDHRLQIPPTRQKVGESSVQLGAYYYSKVLDMEEHFLREHFMKYNLRFYWKAVGPGSRFEEYSHAYIRTFSNIACYQIDRNKFEGELLRLNSENPRFTFMAGITDLNMDLAPDDKPHIVRLASEGNTISLQCDWVVDTSGRSKFLARRIGLVRPNPIHHGTAFMWVDGLVDIDRLTDLSPRETRLKRHRRSTGHLPVWLATNHFMGEGLWFWVIPLQGKTSLGLVYDNRLIPHERVWTKERLLEWICHEFPLFADDLRTRTILDYSTIRDFSYDCSQTISGRRWALCGEAGRFTDPLYSPGSDLISLHNTLVVDAILTGDPSDLETKTRIYEQLMEAFYGATVPSYATSYDALGDQECFVLKYVWELSIYFAFYVFPFINEFFTNGRFIPGFLTRFARLGLVNRTLQNFISGFYQWKKVEESKSSNPIFFDFMDFETLRTSEKMFYEVGVSVNDALNLLNRRLDDLDELARFIIAYLTSRVLRDASVLLNRGFILQLDLGATTFDPKSLAEQYRPFAARSNTYQWSIDPYVMERFRTAATEVGFEPPAVAVGV